DKSTGSVFVQYLDAQCLSIDEPIGTVNYGEIIYPKATIRNNSNTEKTFDVTFWIEGSKYEDTRSITLGPNEEEQLTFAEWVAEPIGSLEIRCTTKLNGDLNNANDQQEGEVFVRFLDVGVIEIIAPTDTVDSGAIILPQAKVKNFGNTTVTFDATFFIEGVKWSSTKPVIDLTPNEERIIEFDSWIADSVGSFTTKCTTQLSGDMNNTNDKEEGQVFVKGGISYGGWFKVGEVPLEPDRKRIKSGGGITRCGDKLYILKGNNTRSLYSYIPGEMSAVFEDTVPFGFGKKVKKGGAITSDGERFLYITKGSNTREFWRYDTQNKVWDSLPLVPIGAGKNLKGGTGITYVNGKVYLLKGSKTNEFYAFDCANNTWIETLPKAPEGSYTGKGYGDGSCLIAYDNNTLYALRGKYNEFYKYDISANTWEKDSGMPFTHPMWNKKKKVGEGAAMVLKGGKICAFKGNNTKEFWSFDPTTKWAGLETIPKMPDKKYVKGGGGLCTWTDGTIYALKGNNTTSIWKYTGSATCLVTLPNTGAQEFTKELSRETFINIVPNPTKGLTKVYYNLPKKEIATLKIYNTLGSMVYSARSDKGEFTIKKLPAGIYLLRLESTGYKEDRKLIVVK
ncbi:MAG: T9SS type A sorting domain-containing protein, partial [candidate division WOR-3 bacterium]